MAGGTDSRQGLRNLAAAAAVAVCGLAVFAPSAQAAAPPNDDFSAAEAIAGNDESFLASNLEATAEPGEPDHYAGQPATSSVWFSWTAAGDRAVTVDTCDSDFDTILAAYTGSSLGGLTQVASADDEGPCSPGSEIEWVAEDGVTYFIAVDGYGGAQGTIDFRLRSPDPPTPGPPETFYVRAGGGGTECTEANPCGTIADALAAHRVTSGPGDVIDVGPGDWAENVDAGDLYDDGLTIRGTLAAGGSHESRIVGEGSGISCPYSCVALIGTEGAEVVLRDVDVDTSNTDGSGGAIFLGGSSDLIGVDATVQEDSFVTAVVEQADEEQGKLIDDSYIDATGSFAVGVFGDGGVTIRDSEVHAEEQAIMSLGCGCSAAEKTTIVRSWISVSEAGQNVMNMAADLELDSSLLTGGGIGAWYQGAGDSNWDVVNTTIDVGAPGQEDGGSTSLSLSNQGTEDVDVNVDSSILVEPIDVWWDPDWASGVGTVACGFSDIRTNTIASEWTDECVSGSGGNTTTDPADLFIGGSPFAFNWKPAADSTAVDSGDPGPLGPGVSATDIDGRPRVMAGTAATCPDGIRDKGAFERGSVCGGPQTYYVTEGGTGTDCTEADPCATIEEALDAHSDAPQPGDVIDVGPGTFVGNVAADLEEDEGLTIRGTLDPDGARMTTIRGEDGGVDGFGPAVALGNCDSDAGVTLRDANVDTVGADPEIGAIALDGGSDLENVHASTQGGAEPTEIVQVCAEGTKIEGSTIDAENTIATATVFAFAGVELVDTTVAASPDGPGVMDFSEPGSGSGVVLTRSTVSSSPSSWNPSVITFGDVDLDSSLVTGGAFGLLLGNGFGGGNEWRVNNATIDAGQPGAHDPGVAGVFLPTADGDAPIDVEISSSIVVDEVINVPLGGGDPGPGTVSCAFSDIQAVELEPSITNDCDLSPGNPSGNTTTDPAGLFAAGDPFSWRLAAGASAIDTGEPGPVDPGLSQTDVAGRPRLVPGTGATCPDGVRDKGAYERGEIPCLLAPPEISGSRRIGDTLTATTGDWSADPDALHFRWLSCDSGGCVRVGSDAGTYQLAPSDGGKRMKVRVRAVNEAGQNSAASAATGVIGLPSADVRPEITGTPRVGQTLTASEGEWSGDPDEFHYAWLSCTGGVCDPVGTDEATYAPTLADRGRRIRVEVTATNDFGSRTSPSLLTAPITGR